MLKSGDILEGVVLEVKEESAVIKFGQRAIEAQVLTDLKVGEEINVQVKGWYNEKLLLRVLNKEDKSSAASIDIKA